MGETRQPDPALLALAARGVDEAPDNAALRTHYGRLLLDGGQGREALVQFQAALSSKPADAELLALAESAATEAGLSDQASAYRALLAGVQPAPAERPKRTGLVRLRAVASGAEGAEAVSHEERTVRLADVAGMDAVKRRLEVSFLGPLANPGLSEAYGKSLRGGLLLWGPPGCGKTFIARAAAGELGARFIAVGLHEVLDMYIGESERKLHEIFERARRAAPCVLFFDEMDALGQKRSNLSESAGRNVVVQFLAELDSFFSRNEGVYVIGATNHPWDVDSALRRPGRLDRALLVLPPDRDARAAILAFHLRGRPVGDVDLDSLADLTDRFSGADLAHLCEAAAELALEDALRTGTVRPVETGDLLTALHEVRPSTMAWLHAARNYAKFANEGGVYDELLGYLDQIGL